MSAPNDVSSEFRILLIEDDPAHAELIMRSLASHPIPNRVHHVSNGEQALDFLFRRNAYADAETSPRPHLVLLDLRLPRIDGHEVLAEIRRSKELKRLPVVVLTTSSAERDVAAAYDDHANSYLVKPLDLDTFQKLLNDMIFYWLAWNQPPPFEPD